MMRSLKITDDILYRLAIIRRGEETVDGGGTGALTHSGLDVLKAELAEEVIAAINEQAQQRALRLASIDDTPKRQAAVVEVSIRPKRRRGGR